MEMLRVKVTAGARKELFEERGTGEFIAKVKEKAEQNQANRRVRELVAAHFGVTVGKVRIITGHRSPNKTIAIGK